MKRRGFLAVLVGAAAAVFGSLVGETGHGRGRKLAYKRDYAGLLPWGPGAMVTIYFRCSTPEKARELVELLKSLPVAGDARPEWDRNETHA